MNHSQLEAICHTSLRAADIKSQEVLLSDLAALEVWDADSLECQSLNALAVRFRVVDPQIHWVVALSKYNLCQQQFR